MAIDREDTLRRAEKLLRQGRLDAALAEYEQVVEAFPHDWNSANALGDLLHRAHQDEKAAAQYRRIADHFFQEGFLPKAVAIYRKVLRVAPGDEHALERVADIAVQQGILVEARQALATLAGIHDARGDAPGAARVRLRLATLDPDDLEARLAAARVALATGGDAARAELRGVADAFEERGDSARALEVLAELLAAVPDDRELATRLVRAHVSRGEHHRALVIANRLGDLDDPDLLFWAGGQRAETGDLDGARAAFARLLAREPHRCEVMVARAADLAAGQPGAALVYLEAAADVLILRGEFGAAAAAYRQFAAQQPRHVDVLQRLVELCMDGDLESDLAGAQAMLVDAYLAEGRGDEARVVAEDLVTRHADRPEHVERLRQALTMAGEADVEGVIAERLSAGGGSDVGDLGSDLAPAPAEEPPAEAAAADPFRLGPVAIDLHDILGDELEQAARQGGGDSGEIDLSAALDQLTAAGAPPEPPKPAAPDLDGVFQEFRDEVSRDFDEATAARHYKLGLTFRDMSMIPEAVRELEAAARSPRLRFDAASALARLLNTQGQTREAVEWFERAAEAPAPSVEDGRALLYDLATTLETRGETGRALAVLLELQADAGEFRDVRRRIDRLSRQRSGG